MDLPCLDILDEGKPKSYVLTGIFMGLAVSTRYHAAPFGIVLPAAHFLRLKSQNRLSFSNSITCSGGPTQYDWDVT